jgi:hypothetical protein
MMLALPALAQSKQTHIGWFSVAPHPRLTSKLEYLPLCVWRQTLLICARASRRTELHSIVAMHAKS